MPAPDPTVTREDVARLEGKLDAYAAGQSARLDAHEQRLNRHDEAIDGLRTAATPTRTSGWTVAAVVVSGVVGMATLISILVALSRLGG